MLEVEIKWKVEGISRSALEERIADNGYSRDSEGTETDQYYYIIKDGVREKDTAVRVRTRGWGTYPESMLAYKGKKQDDRSSTRREIEFSVSSDEDAMALLEALGCEKTLRIVKSRCYYRKGDITLALDEVDGLGTYLELEVLSEEGADYDELVDLLSAQGKALLPEPKREPLTYLELLLKKSM